ncbi:MAG: hypothetical protein GTO45_17500 [Candidatus Aminicenantes bacterium]|nr:hypothetical protein [Candidatus Aminicenantes bacterium]NIM80545.1 hypothetical protein [Candidatus Aminicenantes bacterium]NIN19926.1 hypothetical protein [Candidatus Aminicenantes bacterium]NIN43774.1 hypothetical protein [Candidatus Aminicenantes bacterium]NIN86552.1 hypothetical protein [Candidatus Aminicenantes bacterium]
MNERFFRLSLDAHNRLVIVLDASESAHEQWEEILSLASNTINKLPTHIDKRLFFLSNSQEYNFNNLNHEAKNWREENLSRGSFITPVIKSLGQCTGKIIIIGSGPVYDLEDWLETDFTGKFIFVKVGKSLKKDLNIGIEIEPSELPGYLHNPIQSVEISGKGFMPFYWNNTGYKVILRDEILLCGQQLKEFSISFECYGEETKARIKKSKGEEQIKLKPSGKKLEEKWEILSNHEADVFKRSLVGKEFICPHCSEKHAPKTLMCFKKAPITGEPVYSSFGTRKGFFVFRETKEKISFRHHPVNIIKVGDTQVAIISGNKSKLYQFEQGKWMEKKELKPYYCLSENQYLVGII